MPTSNHLQLPFLGFGSEAALREIADALPDALFMTDPEGRVTFWNRAATAITGWTREEAIGRSCSILAGDAVNGCSCGVGPIRCGLASSGRSSKCCTIRTKDGRETLVVKNAVPILAPDGTATGALETFTDVGNAAGFERLVPDPRRAGAPAPAPDFHGLVGRHPAMLELERMIGLVARSDATVMILGESGAGKERVAEAIHRSSARAAGPFVKVSCSALNENLLESELFGHVKGAFTGALRDRRGRFQEADGGTLLLDEIGDISPLVQVKLLRVIEQREIERVGESLPIRVNVRLLCATHRDLKALVREGRFRADLFFRLAVFPLRVPPLREHVEDLRLLAERFLARVPGPARRLSAGALAVLEAYAWPGNVRELQNVLEYAALQAMEGEIRPQHLPAEVGVPSGAARRATFEVLPGGVAADGPDGSDAAERAQVLAALERHGWNRTRAAEALGISRVTLWKRLKRLGIGRGQAEDGDGEGPGGDA